ncbi:hypothetical protein PJ311_14870 [Bacillus sp. CLL-7-23]|uniref:Uncharacterized protein n=1 Tax=Bacillus changyiensis TaxID=3004103 RepID=A0ABT4X6D4_9BACI|nr:hypothetical protein [Bacillus changyiensis]MDA7027859.1 hypothetical protein [Bacillus changyiensis]
MKKVILSSIASVALVFTLLFVPATKSSASELDADVNSGLAEGEVVVDVYTDFVPDNETIGAEVFLKEDHSFSPLVRSLMWFGVSKTYQGHSYNSWQYAEASTISGGRLTASHTKTVANRYSGTLKIPLRDLEGVVGFDVTDSWSQTVGFVSKEYKSGRYRLEYRHVYKKYKVKQEQKYHPRAKVYATKYVYPQRWVERQYRVVKF